MQIAFTWPELPDYAARCIRQVCENPAFNVSVVATRPSIAIKGMERSLGQSVLWIDETEKKITWASLGTTIPRVLFSGGYSIQVFNSLAAQVRHADGAVILMADNNWQGNLRQRTVESIRHRLLYKKQFDGIFVPGESGEELARHWGYTPGSIARGLYGADPSLFNGGASLVNRSKTILFIGQFIDRKNVIGLVEAFIRISDANRDWTLCLCGDGPLATRIPSHPRVIMKGFMQPPELASLFRDVRCLVLPSHEEHWGLVVHEATLSGCALILSENVGAAADLASDENAVLFPNQSCATIADALQQVMTWDNSRWYIAERMSRELAKGFGPEPFAESVTSVVKKLCGNTDV